MDLTGLEDWFSHRDPAAGTENDHLPCWSDSDLSFEPAVASCLGRSMLGPKFKVPDRSVHLHGRVGSKVIAALTDRGLIFAAQPVRSCSAEKVVATELMVAALHLGLVRWSDWLICSAAASARSPVRPQSAGGVLSRLNVSRGDRRRPADFWNSCPTCRPSAQIRSMTGRRGRNSFRSGTRLPARYA